MYEQAKEEWKARMRAAHGDHVRFSRTPTGWVHAYVYRGIAHGPSLGVFDDHSGQSGAITGGVFVPAVAP
jgi:hypothetical protein